MPAYILTFPQDILGFAAEDPTEVDPYDDGIEQTMALYRGATSGCASTRWKSSKATGSHH